MTDADNPSYKDESCPGPGGQAYNEPKARAEFGDEFIDRLMQEQSEFRGDWWQLAKLVKNLKDDEIRQFVKFGGPLHDWNTWRKCVEAMATSGEQEERVHLEHARLDSAHLEHAMLRFAHLEHADLMWAHLEFADLAWAHLQNATLHFAILYQADLTCADLEDATLDGAHLEFAKLHGAILHRTSLYEAHLQHADCMRARLAIACLEGAHLENANLCRVEFCNADLSDAVMTGAVLTYAGFSEANLRQVKGLLFDDNRVRDIDIEGDAPDPWSVLRREYTGPWFFAHLLLLMVFFTPYVAQVFSLTMQSRGQEWAFAQFARLESALGDAHAAAGREACAKAVDTMFRDWTQRAEGAMAELKLPEETRRELMTRLTDAGRSGNAFCDAMPDLRAALRSLREDYEATHPERRAVWMLLGDKGGWGWLLPAIVVLYNVIRGYLTMRVSMLRDAEERSQHTPTLEEYYGICHPLRTVPGKKKIGEGDGDGEDVRVKKSGWRHAVVAALFVTPGWERRDPHSVARFSQLLRWSMRHPLNYVSEIPLRFGLYRLHLIARVLFWVALFFVVRECLDWANKTMIRVPVVAKADLS